MSDVNNNGEMTTRVIAGSDTAPVSSAFNRPADTTAYAVGDLVANSTTAGSVTPLAFALRAGGPLSGILRRVSLRKSSAGLTNASFRLHFFNSAPVVGAGDNAVLSLANSADYVGRADITLDQAFGDGSWGFTDLTFTDQHFKTAAGTLYALIEARGAYTPTSGETITARVEVLRD
jgi:hypothetical protein